MCSTFKNNKNTESKCEFAGENSSTKQLPKALGDWSISKICQDT